LIRLGGQLESKTTTREEKDEAAEKINKLSLMYYKQQMDKLYYSGKYRKPEMAAIFNAYMGICQHLMGMQGSIGCKSANDRTYVARLLIATLSTQDPALIPSLDVTNPEDYKLFKSALMQTLAKPMSNSAIFAAINDTRGGTPKVDNKKFPIIIDKISEYGKNAAHKLKNNIKTVTNKKIEPLRELEKLDNPSINSVITTKKFDSPKFEKEELQAMRQGRIYIGDNSSPDEIQAAIENNRQLTNALMRIKEHAKNVDLRTLDGAIRFVEPRNVESRNIQENKSLNRADYNLPYSDINQLLNDLARLSQSNNKNITVNDLYRIPANDITMQVAPSKEKHQSTSQMIVKFNDNPAPSFVPTKLSHPKTPLLPSQSSSQKSQPRREAVNVKNKLSEHRQLKKHHAESGERANKITTGRRGRYG
jgi:hypothetical protein